MTLVLVLVACAVWLLEPPDRRLARPAHRRPSRGLAPNSPAAPTPADRVSMPIALDLLAAALRAGQPVDAAARLVGSRVGGWFGAELARVGALLRLGAEPTQAWAELARHPATALISTVAARSADSGIRLARALADCADELRAERRAEALARASRVAVWTLVPVALCFLPAFVCLGIVPTVVGLVGQAGLP